MIVSSIFFFFKQKTAYEMRISDWSSDVCSSDLGVGDRLRGVGQAGTGELGERLLEALLVEHPVGDLDGGVGDALVGGAAVAAGEGEAGRRVGIARHLLLAVGAARAVKIGRAHV